MVVEKRYFTSHKHIDTVEVGSARIHRYKNDTPILLLLAAELGALGYTREHAFIFDKAGSRYRLDFANAKHKINVEFDGLNHVKMEMMDATRDKRLASHGWAVVRIVGAQKPDATLGRGYLFTRPAIGQPSPQLRRLYRVLERLFG